MTRKAVLWLMLAIGILTAIGAALLLRGGREEQAHEGARFVQAEVSFLLPRQL